jgi:small subunit ribosomal protein S5
MAEKETKNDPKDLVEATPEEVEKIEVAVKEVIEEVEKPTNQPKDVSRDRRRQRRDDGPSLDSWVPKTNLGKLVKTGKEKDLDKILETGKKILESEIVDTLLPLETDLILIGQAKGKFGGGKRRAWRQTQKKTQQGNVISFSAMAVAGDKKNHIGIGFGKARETLPAREKAVRNSKLNIIRIERGFESPEAEKENSIPHTVPFKVEGKCGSVRITLIPAPRGTGLVTGDECKKILKLAGIKDAYVRTKGKTKTAFNLAKACVDALSKTVEMELQ